MYIDIYNYISIYIYIYIIDICNIFYNIFVNPTFNLFDY